MSDMVERDWRALEHAPDDGTPVLLRFTDGHGDVRYAVGYRYKFTRWMTSVGFYALPDPDAFMNLDAALSTKGEG